MPDAAPQPIAVERRLFALDALRGIALLGVFTMNVPTFARSMFAALPGERPPWRGVDAAVFYARELLVAGRFNVMFAMLFGIGFVLQLRRLEAAAPAAAAGVYARRLAALFAIGIVHAAFLWSGDVLSTYAVLGVALLALRRAPAVVVLALALATALLPSFDLLLRPFFVTSDASAASEAAAQALRASNSDAFGSASLVAAWRENLKNLAWFYGTPLGGWSIALFVALMASGVLLGAWLARTGVVDRLGAFVDAAADPATDRDLTVAGWWLLGATLVAPLVGLPSLGQVAVMLLYASLVVRLAARPRGRAWLAPFANVGRMPLTNYLLQSVMASLVFYGIGLGLYDRVGPAGETLIAIALFVLLQIPFSAWYLARHRSGPMERLWRRLTYGQPTSSA